MWRCQGCPSNNGLNMCPGHGAVSSHSGVPLVDSRVSKEMSFQARLLVCVPSRPLDKCNPCTTCISVRGLIFLLSGVVKIGTLILKQLNILFNLNLSLNTLGLWLPTLSKQRKLILFCHFPDRGQKSLCSFFFLPFLYPLFLSQH